MSSRLGVFSFHFCVGTMVSVVALSRHFMWLSKTHSHELQYRFASLEVYADECEGMERTLTSKGIPTAHIPRCDENSSPLAHFLPFPRFSSEKN